MEYRIRIINVSMDVHSTSVYVVALKDDGEIVLEKGIKNEYRKIVKTIRLIEKKHPGCIIRCCYEAGPSGYRLARKLRAEGIGCMVVAPGKIPRKKNERIKTDRRDAMSLARLMALGALSEVAVPNEEDEEVRELLRYRYKKREELAKVKKQIKSFLARYELKSPHPGTWTKKYKEWIRTVDCGLEGLNKVKYRYYADLQRLEAEVGSIEKELRVRAESPRYADRIWKLQLFRGIGFLTAFTFVVEIGDFRRFQTAERFMAFIGLVPSEHSSGERIARGKITKTGNKQLRKLLIEACWHYFMHRSAKTAEEEENKYTAYALKADDRLRRKKFRLSTINKKNEKVVVTALARELAGFIWGMMTDAVAI
jgi:transposase